MTGDTVFSRALARFPVIAVAAYAALIIVLITSAWLSLADILDKRAAIADSVDILARLEARQNAPGETKKGSATAPIGSPFLDGETITVAGAGLLQRVTGAVTRLGGTVQSSQVDLHGPRATDGFITLTVSCELAQASLQKLLYDLEAGMPFLFVDQLIAQGPGTSTAAAAGRMKILLAVSGQWKASN